MKALVVATFICILICVEAEIGFTLNGTFNPGFTIAGARKRQANIRNDEVEDGGDTEWPKPDSISNFPVPDSFVNAQGDTTLGNDNSETTTQAANGRHRPRRFHRH